MSDVVIDISEECDISLSVEIYEHGLSAFDIEFSAGLHLIMSYAQIELFRKVTDEWFIEVTDHPSPP